MNQKMFLVFILSLCVLFGLLNSGVQTQTPIKAQITFETTRDGKSEIYMMDMDGKNPRNLTNNPASDWQPDWPPDGKKIAFASNQDGQLNFEIYVIDADGKNPRRLTNHPANEWSPSWSPDGQRIAFVLDKGNDAEIYVVNVDGKNLQNLTEHPAYDTLPSWFDPAMLPVSSPGKHVTTWGWIKHTSR